ncbi:MAG: CoA transferase [Chloroflexi bacterium]|nr:CoA transferase [Chloroflexota bacterium]
MTEEKKTEGMLSPYRVLDLTDEKGLLCGKLLGDLGADVIKVERPGGDSARKIGPFYHDEADPEKSLFWFAFNTSKRGITLDIKTAAGQATFKQLVETADFVIESFPPGYMNRLGLGYSALEKVNPGIIMVSVTPFGQTGPYKDYKAPDIVAWAMGGYMYAYGTTGRSPVRMSHYSQAYLNAASRAMLGAMLALYHREMTGEGQQVDVSIQESVAKSSSHHEVYWDMRKVNKQWTKGLLGGDIRLKLMWACKDGYVLWTFFGGTGGMRRSRPLVELLDSEGMADDFLREFDWEVFNTAEATEETVKRLEEPTSKFFMAHTKAELLEMAVKRRLQLYPVATTKDILESVQLAAREFWVEIAHPELGTTITYPGAFVKTAEAPPRISRRAPLIGEHNQEILQKELALPKQELLALRQAKDYPARLNRRSQRENLPKKLFEGVKVVGFTWVVVGPAIIKALADYGAEVIKIEGRSHPDQLRVSGGPVKDGIPGVDRNGWVAWFNSGQLSVALNLATPKGVELAKRFVARADIVVENMAGGVMKRMGLGYEELKKVKPDIIMLSACMQGQTGPHFNLPGLGSHLAALAGFCQITGWPEQDPTEVGAYTDYIVPSFAASCLAAALLYRRHTGRGQYIDMSQYEAGAHFMAPLILDYVVNQRIANRMGNRHIYAAPHGAYRCRGEDRWCVVAVFTDDEWGSFARVIGNPAWTNDSRVGTLLSRKKNEDELDRLVEEWTINHSPEEVMNLMQVAGVAAGVVETCEDLMEHDPQLRQRRFFLELDHPEGFKHHVPRHAFVLSKLPGEVRRAPLLGEHNEYALKELLGMSDDEIAELVIEGVVE